MWMEAAEEEAKVGAAVEEGDHGVEVMSLPPVTGSLGLRVPFHPTRTPKERLPALASQVVSTLVR